MNKETVLRGLFKLSKQIVTSAMDSSAPAPSLNPESASTVFTVDGVYNVTNVGTAFTGIVSKGTIRLGDKAYILLKNGSSVLVTINRIEVFKKLLDSASAGTKIGLSFSENITKESVLTATSVIVL